MDIENIDIEEMDLEESNEEKISKVSRARNRTVMLSAEVTGDVRKAIDAKTEKEDNNDFVKPGQIAQTAKKKVKKQKQEKNSQNSENLKFGKSRNRTRTTKINREDLDKVLNQKSLDFTEEIELPQPNVPQPKVSNPNVIPASSKLNENSFNPLTSLAPSNCSAGNPLANKESSHRKTKQTPALNAPNTSASNKPTSNKMCAPRTNNSIKQPVQNIVKSPVEINSGTALKGKTKIIGFLVTFTNDENGEVYQIRQGRKLITSRPTEHGDSLLIDDESVSPLHAIIRTTKDYKIQIMDQLSEHGTAIIRAGQDEEIEVAGGLETVNNGDVLRIGNVKFLVCLLP